MNPAAGAGKGSATGEAQPITGLGAPQPPQPRSELGRYALVGGLSFAVDFGALILGYRVLSLPVWIATSLGFWLSFVVNFAANKYWTFGARTRTAGQIWRYSVLVGVNYLATVVIVAGLSHLGLDVVLAKAVAVVLLTASTFVAYRHWVFASPTMTTMILPRCCVCSTPMRPSSPQWCFRCPECGTWGSTLPLGINSDAHERLDEDLRETGLADLRRHNDAVVVNRLLDLGLAPDARLLDVGCAFGWFLGSARAVGIAAEGLEPDKAVADRARGQGVAGIRDGFFPDALDNGERFDAITYNDVLEHFPDAKAAVASSAAHLSAGGLLSVNIPNSRGLFYRLATVLRTLGLRGAFERLWQVGLPSPHVWFFDRSGLTLLGELNGLELVHAGSLDSVRRAGLWQRAHSDRRPSLTSVVGVAVVWLLAPVFNHPRASDIMHLVFRKPEGSPT